MPKDEKNIGGILRAAHCYDASLILVSGARYRKTPTDTAKAARQIPLMEVDNFKNPPVDCVKVAVEITEGATPLPEFKHPERALYIFGPEDGSLPEEVLGNCKHRVYVPTTHCMNLAATANVVLYDRMLKQAPTHNEGEGV
jgi:tRNA(Leu) C34 or U34 (ribose-2'-O)-methylase TrmL